jgi:hypothetical protein
MMSGGAGHASIEACEVPLRAGIHYPTLRATSIAVFKSRSA